MTIPLGIIFSLKGRNPKIQKFHAASQLPFRKVFNKHVSFNGNSELNSTQRNADASGC